MNPAGRTNVPPTSGQPPRIKPPRVRKPSVGPEGRPSGKDEFRTERVCPCPSGQTRPDESGGSYESDANVRSAATDKAVAAYESEWEPEGLYGALKIVPGGPYGAGKTVPVRSAFVLTLPVRPAG